MGLVWPTLVIKQTTLVNTNLSKFQGRVITKRDGNTRFDDQQVLVTVALAALINALKIVDNAIQEIRIMLIGIGAANVATYRLFKAVKSKKCVIRIRIPWIILTS